MTNTPYMDWLEACAAERSRIFDGNPPATNVRPNWLEMYEDGQTPAEAVANWVEMVGNEYEEYPVDCDGRRAR